MVTDAERQKEIQQLEQDLRNLQRRYAHLDRAARRFRAGFYVLVAAMGIVIFVFAVMGRLPAALFSAAVLLATILFIFAYGRMFSELRLIDWVGWWPGHVRWGVKRSEAEAVEDMVAERIERLARLKGN